MKLKTILSSIGSNALKTISGVNIVFSIIEFINDLLPEDECVTENHTGNDIIRVLERFMSPNRLEKILNHEFEFEIESIRNHAVIAEALSEVDKMGKSTRPYIAKLIAINTVIIIDLIVIGFLYAILAEKKEMADIIKESWPLIVGTLTPFIVLLRSYFGLRSKEKFHKYEALTNIPGPLNVVSKLIESLKKK